MKTKRRHELHTNALADWLAHYVDQARPYFGWLVGGAIVVILALLGWSYFSGRSENQMHDGWNSANVFGREATVAVSMDDSEKLQAATKSLAKIAEEYAGTPLAAFAQATLGDVHLFRGQTLMWSPRRSEARKSMEDAVSHYGTAIKLAGDPLLKNRLQLNLGTAYEWLFQLDDARRAYEQVEDGIYKPVAQQQLAALAQATEEHLFERLEKYEAAPVPAAGKRPGLEFGSEHEDLGRKFRDFGSSNIRGEDLVPPFVRPLDSAQPTAAAAQASGADN